MTLWSFTAREVRSRPGRAILTLLSIVIGVTAVVSILVATTTVRAAFREMYQFVTGRATLIVTSAGGGQFDEEVLKEIQKIPGIRAAVPSLKLGTNVTFDRKQAPSAAGEETSNQVKNQFEVMGIDPARDSEVREFQVDKGQPLSSEGSGAVMESSVFSSLKLQLGDTIRISGARNSRTFRESVDVIGTVKPKEGASIATGGVVFLSLTEAQRIFKATGKINFVHIVTDESADVARVERELTKILPPELKVDRAGLSTKQAEEAILPTEQGLQLATGAAIVLSLFIILNTFLMNVGERRRQLAIMRALGATRGQIVWLLLREGLLMGLIGTVIGIGVGLAGAIYLARAMEGLFQSRLPALHISAFPIICGAVVGLGMSLLGTFIPARRAGRLSPLEGMSRVAQEDRQPVHWGMTLAGASKTLLGAAGLTGCILGYLPVTFAVSSSVLLMVGMMLLIPLFLRPVSQAVLFLLRPILSLEGQLAHGTLLRRRTRTALTVGVLFIALAMGLGMGSAVVDNIRDVRDWYRVTIVGDLFVRASMPSAKGDTIPIPDEFGDLLKDVPGIRRTDTMRLINPVYLDLTGRPGAEQDQMAFTLLSRGFTLSEKAPLNLVDGDPEEVVKQLRAGEVVMGTVLAQRAGVKQGDDVGLRTTSGVKKFRVAALANDYTASGYVIYMQRDVAKNNFNYQGESVFIIDADKDQLPATMAQLKQLSEDHGLILQTAAEIVGVIDGMVAGVANGQWLILGLGFIVASFGIVNTLTMNVLEQTREIGLLRIVAMTRSQVRKLILSQAAIIGILGLGPGIAAGVVVSYLINLSMLPVLGHPVRLHMHPEMVLGCFALGLVISLIAAMFPAERAARLDLTTALQYE